MLRFLICILGKGFENLTVMIIKTSLKTINFLQELNKIVLGSIEKLIQCIIEMLNRAFSVNRSCIMLIDMIASWVTFIKRNHSCNTNNENDYSLYKQLNCAINQIQNNAHLVSKIFKSASAFVDHSGQKILVFINTNLGWSIFIVTLSPKEGSIS